VEAQEALAALAASEHARAAELNAVILAMGEGVFVCDADGRIILANPAAENVFPDVAEETYAEILAQVEDPDGLAPRLGERGGPIELRTRGNEECWVELSTWPVARRPGSDGAHRDETIVMLRDVTEQRQRQAVRDTFIGVLSHELRTPVTTIYAGSKVLARSTELTSATQREIFDDIAGEAERLHRLVEDVVAMTRFGEDEGELGAEPVLLQRILPSVVTSEEGRWPDTTFSLDIPQGLPTVVADPTYVEQVIRNLLSNAAKYGGRGTTVETRVESDADEVRVRILDDGPGFPPEEADRLFELYFRSARTARAAAGAGIGLFVCARLIRAMGGRIWASNRPEGGSEFGFSLRVMIEDD
jgi:two-component system phosphate regulon sensor histidine kinase PhoR